MKATRPLRTRHRGFAVKLYTKEPKVGGAKLSDGSTSRVDGQLGGTPPSCSTRSRSLCPRRAPRRSRSERPSTSSATPSVTSNLKSVGADAGGRALLEAARVPADAAIDVGEQRRLIAAAKTRAWIGKKPVDLSSEAPPVLPRPNTECPGACGGAFARAGRFRLRGRLRHSKMCLFVLARSLLSTPPGEAT